MPETSALGAAIAAGLADDISVWNLDSTVNNADTSADVFTVSIPESSESFIDAARVAFTAGSVQRSLRRSHHSSTTRHCCGFVGECPVGNRYQSIAALAQQQERYTAVLSSKCSSDRLAEI